MPNPKEPHMNVEKLLELLETPQVKDRLRAFFNSEHSAAEEQSPAAATAEQETLNKKIWVLEDIVKNLRAENSTLKQAQTTLQTEVKTHKAHSQELLNKNTALAEEKQQLDEQNRQLLQKTERYESEFSDDIQAVQSFSQLAENTRTALQGIFKSSSMKGFIACGVQEKNLHSLWDYTKNRLMERADAETAILVELFLFFFSRYRLAYPNYQLQEVPPGELFDPEQHIRSSQSRASGVISRVILSGWINSKNQKIIKTSVVEIN